MIPVDPVDISLLCSVFCISSSSNSSNRPITFSTEENRAALGDRNRRAATAAAVHLLFCCSLNYNNSTRCSYTPELMSISSYNTPRTKYKVRTKARKSVDRHSSSYSREVAGGSTQKYRSQSFGTHRYDVQNIAGVCEVCGGVWGCGCYPTPF